MKGMLVTFACAVVLATTAAPAAAAPKDERTAAAAAAAAAVEGSAQTRKRVRPQIRVTPRYYPRRNFHTTYPLPYQYEWPGPGAVRECRARYVQEFRPSGTVIVPRMNCWWARG